MRCVGDGWNEIVQDPMSGETKIVGIGSEGAFELPLHPMEDCESECSGIVTTQDGVYYGPVTEGTALRALKDLPFDMEFDCAMTSDLAHRHTITERRPWSALPRHR